MYTETHFNGDISNIPLYYLLMYNAAILKNISIRSYHKFPITFILYDDTGDEYIIQLNKTQKKRIQYKSCIYIVTKNR